MPTATDFTWARSRFGTVDLGRHVEGFVLRCQAHGYRYRDISAAWKAWLSQDVAAGKAPADKTAPPAAGAIPGTIPGVGHARQSVAEQRVNAWMAVADRLKDARLKDTQHTPSHTRPRF